MRELSSPNSDWFKAYTTYCRRTSQLYLVSHNMLLLSSAGYSPSFQAHCFWEMRFMTKPEKLLVEVHCCISLAAKYVTWSELVLCRITSLCIWIPQVHVWLCWEKHVDMEDKFILRIDIYSNKLASEYISKIIEISIYPNNWNPKEISAVAHSLQYYLS